MPEDEKLVVEAVETRVGWAREICADPERTDEEKVWPRRYEMDAGELVALLRSRPRPGAAVTTREEALALALDWAEGRRSWTNLGSPHAGGPYTPDVIAAMDAQEVVKWAALAAVLPPEPPAGDAVIHCGACGSRMRLEAGTETALAFRCDCGEYFYARGRALFAVREWGVADRDREAALDALGVLGG